MIDPLPIRPITGRLDADVALPGSKSLTNRALVCAALAEGRSVLRGALIADDTLAMVGALRALGCAVAVDDTTITVDGSGGRFPVADVTVDARLSGTTSRFVLGIAHLAAGAVTIDGAAPLRARPMADGVAALRAAGRTVDDAGGHLPIVVGSSSHPAPAIAVSGEVSSQFLSALLLSAPVEVGGQTVSVTGTLRSAEYVAMTVAVMERFGARVERRGNDLEVGAGGYRATDVDIEPDASAASYAFGAAALVGGRVGVEGLGTASLQGDVGFVDILEAMGAGVHRTATTTEVVGATPLRGIAADLGSMSDTAQTLACLAPFADAPVQIDGIGFIRHKETDRIAAVVTELRRLGVEAAELPDGIRIEPGRPGGGVVRTYHDHRMAMSFALIGLVVDGISIEDPRCVDKTFPGYWSMLDDLRRSAS